jgi:hypothetical protein
MENGVIMKLFDENKHYCNLCNQSYHLLTNLLNHYYWEHKLTKYESLKQINIYAEVK